MNKSKDKAIDKIKVGDEVLYHKFYENSNQVHKGVVTNISYAYSPYAFVMKDDGDFVTALLTDLSRTGRHFSQIEEVIKKLKGVKRISKTSKCSECGNKKWKRKDENNFICVKCRQKENQERLKNG